MSSRLIRIWYVPDDDGVFAVPDEGPGRRIVSVQWDGGVAQAGPRVEVTWLVEAKE